MNKKTIYLFYAYLFMISLILVEFIYLNANKTATQKKQDQKSKFVSLVGLSDLAISTEATFIRHRSISDLFSIYRDDPTLREYFTSSYTISNSGIINQRNKNEK
jgi:hypothetical protein